MSDGQYALRLRVSCPDFKYFGRIGDRLEECNLGRRCRSHLTDPINGNHVEISEYGWMIFIVQRDVGTLFDRADRDVGSGSLMPEQQCYLCQEYLIANYPVSSFGFLSTLSMNIPDIPMKNALANPLPGQRP